MKTTDKKTRGQEDEKAVTIIVTVLPPKKGGRKMLVSAARDGEMPLVLSGLFADRHHLLDQAYAMAMKREAQIVTVKEDKKKRGQEEEEPGNREPDEDGERKIVAEIDTARDGDQLVAAKPVTEELPAIEGDEAGSAQTLSDISSSEDGTTEVGDGEPD